MTDMTTTFSGEREVGREASPVTPPTISTESVVITEQQVLFSTAAAVALPRERTRRFSDVVHSVGSAVGSCLASAVKPPQPVHPKRHVWLETALMSREMDRL